MKLQKGTAAQVPVISGLASLAMVLGACGCMEAPPSQEGSVGESSEALAYWSDAALWSNSPQVCFQNNAGDCQRRCSASLQLCSVAADCSGAGNVCGNSCGDGTMCTTDAQCAIKPVNGFDAYADAKALVQTALTEGWGAPSGLVFNYLGDCPANPAASVMIVNLITAGPTGQCGFGAGADCWFGILARGWIQQRALHEVGHALGLPHEQKRSNETICPILASQVPACQACVGGTCSAANFNACFYGSPPRTGTQTLTQQELVDARSVVWNSGPDSRAKPLTPYDPLSEMNYCAEPKYGGGRFFHDTDPTLTDWRPTAYDSLGIEILYPKAGAIPLRCTNCVQSGTGVIVRTNAVIEDDWSGRDAFPWWKTGTTPTWKNVTTNASLPSGATLASSSITGAPTVKFTATNQWNGKTISAQGVVDVSDSKWTSVVMAVL